MAKKSKVVGTYDANALNHIRSYGDVGMYVPESVYGPLLSAGLVELVPDEGIGPDGNRLVRAVSVAKPEIMSGFAPPERKRGRASGDRKWKFDALGVGEFFFVEATESRPDPAKSLASSVTSATARYRVPTGAMVTKNVIAKDADGNKLLDASGKPVRQAVSVPEMSETRKFKIVSVEANVTYGSFTAPANGAVIYREV